MNIRVEYYGVLTDVTGIPYEIIEHEPGGKSQLPTIGQIVELACQRHPGLTAHLPHTAFALNDGLVPADTEVSEGCVIGLLPPVNGG